MNRRIAIATLALMMSTVSFVSAEERHEGIAGKYKEKSGGEMTIRKADDAKMEAGPWRFVLKGEGDWACSQGVDSPGGGKPTIYFIEFAEGKFKGERYNIVRDKDGKVKELQRVGGSKAIWVKQAEDANYEGLLGKWELDFPKNDFHYVEITAAKNGEPGPYVWTNKAGKSWPCAAGYIQPPNNGPRTYTLTFFGESPYPGHVLHLLRDSAGKLVFMKEHKKDSDTDFQTWVIRRK